jgi:uncharacterized membrane protein YedE/YeeE
MAANPVPRIVVPEEKADLQPPAALAVVAATVLGAFLLTYGGLPVPAFSLVAGLALGFTFQRSRFCFAAAFRDFILFRSTEVARAVVLLLLLTSLGFTAAYFYSALNGLPITPHLRPAGLHTATGAAIFGIGMVIAGGCATGMLMRLGEGYVQQYGTLLGFLAGSLLGAWHRFFWLPVIEASPVVFLPAVFGWPLAVILQSAVLLALWLALARLAPQSGGGEAPEGAPLFSRQRLFRQVWSYNTGAIVIAFLATILHLYRDRAFTVTTGITYWSAWLYTRFGGELADWVYFQKVSRQIAMEKGFLMTIESLLNVGFILGALAGSLAASEARLRHTRSARHLLVSVAGGLLMGYGARVSQGCNIGAFSTAIGSFSLNGWVFAVFAFLGAYLGARLVLLLFVRNE